MKKLFSFAVIMAVAFAVSSPAQGQHHPGIRPFINISTGNFNDVTNVGFSSLRCSVFRGYGFRKIHL